MAGFFGGLWAQMKQELVEWVNNLIGTPEGRKKLGASVLIVVIALYFGIPFWTLLFFAVGCFLISAAAKKYSLPWIVTAILMVVLVLAAGIDFALQKNPVTKKSMSQIMLFWDVEFASRMNHGNAETRKALYENQKEYDKKIVKQVKEKLANIKAGEDSIKLEEAIALALKSKARRDKINGALGDMASYRKPLGGQVSKQPTLVFEKSYTFADAFNEYGQIDTFKFVDDGVNVGDRIEVIAKPIDGGEFSGKEVGIWRGEKFSPPWNMTVKGYYSSTVEFAPAGKILMISLNSRKDLRVIVRVTRGINLKS